MASLTPCSLSFIYKDAGSSKDKDDEFYECSEQSISVTDEETSTRVCTSTIKSTPPRKQPKLDLAEPQSAPRFVDLDRPTSCVQCEIKGLPCDMKRPQCSRCSRMSEQVCLVQRQTGLQDILHPVGPLTKAVLVKSDSDNQEGWDEKTALRAQVSKHDQAHTTRRSNRY